MLTTRKPADILAASGLSFLVAAIFISAAGEQRGLFLILFITLAALGWIISRMGWQSMMFLFMAFILPLSVDVELAGMHRVSIPAEPVLGLMVMVMAWDSLRIPGYLRRLLKGESKWVIPLLLVLLAGIPFSSDPQISLKAVLVRVVYILVFFIQLRIHLRSREPLFHRMMQVFSVSLLLVLGYSMVRYSTFDWNPLVVKGIFRPFYADHTIIGASMAIMGVYWVGNAFSQRNVRIAAPALALGMVFLLIVLLSGSRAALLSIPVGIGVMLIRLMGARLIHMAALSLLLVAGLVLARPTLEDWVLRNRHDSGDMRSDLVEQTASVGNVTTDVSNMERINRWIAGIRMFQARPLRGYGTGTYQYAYIPFQSERFYNRLTVTDPYNVPENSGGTAHSEYILALSENGLPGLVAWLLILGRWTCIAFKGRHRRWMMTSLVIAIASLSTYFFHAFFNNFLDTDTFAFLFWGIGAFLGVRYEEQRVAVVHQGVIQQIREDI